MPLVTRTVPIPGPRNNRAAAVAQERLSAIVPLAQQESLNSIGVNAFPSLIYHLLTPGGGKVCTCSRVLDTSKDAPLFDANGNASSEHITSLLEGSQFGIIDYGKKPTGGNVIGSRGGPFTAPVDDVIAPPTATTISPTDPTIGEVVDISHDSFEVPTEAYGNGACPVCFGTGVVGGFQVYGGRRIVVDSTHTGLQLNAGVTVDQLEAPYDLLFFGVGANAAFTMTLPYLGVVQSVRTFHKRELVPFLVQIQDGSGVWQPFDPTTASTYMDGLPHNFRLLSPYPEEGRLTYLEIQITQSDLVPIDFSKLSRTGDLSILDPLQDVQLCIPPTIPYLYPGDIVADSIYGKLWRIKTVEYNNTLKRNLAFQCDARLVQEYEFLHQLWIPPRQDYAQVSLEPRAVNQTPSTTLIR